MAVIKTFEELKCWQKARDLVKIVYTISSTGPISKDFDMRSQIRRAAVSVVNNVSEGFGRESNKEFIRFLDIAHASCIEVKSMTYLLEDLSYVTAAVAEDIRTKANEVKALIRGLMKYLRTDLEH